MIDIKSQLLQCFMHNHQRLRLVARRELFAPEWADDVLHDAYLRILTSNQESLELRDPLHYCARVVQNVAMDYCRTRMKELSDHVEVDESEAAGGADSGLWPDGQVNRRQQRNRLQRRLASLEPRLRQVFVMRYFQGRSQREIAAAIGCALGGVGALVQASLRALGVRPDARTSAFLDTSTMSE